MFSPTVARANAVLMLNPSVPLEIGEVQRLASLSSYAVAQSALETLSKRDLVRGVQRAGRLAFAPNRRSPYHRVAYQAALIDLPWMESLAAKGVDRAQVRAIFVHGSIARGDAGARSDLDVLVIGAVEPTTVLAAFRPIEQMIGRTIDPAVFRTEQVRDKLEAGDKALESILNNGIRVWGEFE